MVENYSNMDKYLKILYRKPAILSIVLNKIQNRPESVHTFLIEKILIFYYKCVTLLFVCIVQEDGKQ